MGDEGPALWMFHPFGKSTLQAGVHANGNPFILVSDRTIRNFGLGRTDGTLDSPILVFRSADLVKMVFGLSMTEAGQPAFFAYYNSEGKKTDFLGHYCDSPSRVCTQ